MSYGGGLKEALIMVVIVAFIIGGFVAIGLYYLFTWLRGHVDVVIN